MNNTKSTKSSSARRIIVKWTSLSPRPSSPPPPPPSSPSSSSLSLWIRRAVSKVLPRPPPLAKSVVGVDAAAAVDLQKTVEDRFRSCRVGDGIRLILFRRRSTFDLRLKTFSLNFCFFRINGSRQNGKRGDGAFEAWSGTKTAKLFWRAYTVVPLVLWSISLCTNKQCRQVVWG